MGRIYTLVSLHRTAPVLGAAIGVCVTVASPLASPRQDHALLMELAGREFVRCQDDLAKLRRISQSDDQTIDQTIKTMAVRVAAAAEADCEKLKQAIDAAAETDGEHRLAEMSGSTMSPSLRSGQGHEDASANRASAAPAGAGAAEEAQSRVPPAPQPGQQAANATETPRAEAAPSTAQTPAPTLSIHFPSTSDAAAAEAKALAAQFGSSFQRTETHAEPEAVPKALVLYSDQADHGAAKSIARTLADKHYTWRLERRATAQTDTPSRLVEVWLPSAKHNPADAQDPHPARR